MAALFVLFGLLLNVGAAGGQLDRDPRAARLGSGDIVRTDSAARLAARADDDDSGHDEVLGPPPAAPAIISLATTAYPAAAAEALVTAPRALDLPLSYRARAPPAA